MHNHSSCAYRLRHHASLGQLEHVSYRNHHQHRSLPLQADSVYVVWCMQKIRQIATTSST